MMGDAQIKAWDLIGNSINNSFHKSYKLTIGCDIGTADVKLEFDLVTFSIWDISLQERFRFFRHSFYRGASCALLIFDLTRYSSFNPTIVDFVREIYTHMGPVPVILVGFNADKTEDRQISRAQIEELCGELPDGSYFEIGSNQDEIRYALERAAELSLNAMGQTIEFRRKAYEFQKKLLENFIETLEELGFHINDENMVEIFTHRGLFSVNISNAQVLFESLHCSNCGRSNCVERNKARRKSLCIVPASVGWSNLDLETQQLLILAKIFAIMDDKLPLHVLNQMSELNCHTYLEPSNTFIEPAQIDFSEDDLILAEEIHLETAAHEEIPFDDIENETSIRLHEDLFDVAPSEAKTLLRNYKILFEEGRLPFSLYELLRTRYETIIQQN